MSNDPRNNNNADNDITAVAAALREQVQRDSQRSANSIATLQVFEQLQSGIKDRDDAIKQMQNRLNSDMQVRNTLQLRLNHKMAVVKAQTVKLTEKNMALSEQRKDLLGKEDTIRAMGRASADLTAQLAERERRITYLERHRDDADRENANLRQLLQEKDDRIKELHNELNQSDEVAKPVKNMLEAMGYVKLESGEIKQEPEASPVQPSSRKRPRVTDPVPPTPPPRTDHTNDAPLMMLREALGRAEDNMQGMATRSVLKKKK